MNKPVMLVAAALLGAALTAAAPRAWRLVEEVRIGPADDGPSSFGSMVALTVDAAGRIYVLETRPQDIRVFGADGRFIRRIGRPGAGPGEYQNANGLAWDSLGRLLVVDQQYARNTWFDTTGRYVTSQTRPVSGFYGWTWGGTVLNDGRVVEPLSIREGNDSRSALAWVDAQGRLRDTLRFPSSNPGHVWVLARNGGRLHMQVPFTPGGLTHIDRRGFLWVARTDRYRIMQLSLRGDTVRVVERAATPLPVTRREVDSIMNVLEARHGAGPDLDRSKIPATKPLIRSLITDDEGRLWVRLVQEGGGTAFDVFDANGRYVDRASTPLRLGMHQVIRRGMLYTDARDEDDLPFLVRLRIAR